MVFSSDLDEEALLREIGQRVEAIRLARNLTQAQLAAEAGVSRRTIERLEAGSVGAQLSMFLRVCRALDLVPRFDMLLPAPEAGPLELLRQKQARRKRARKVKEQQRTTWTWGEEA